MRRLGVTASGGRRRSLQTAVAAFGIETGHFTPRSAGLRYSDEALAAAVATSTTLREVARKLGAAPATGTLSHLRRRIAAAGIDTGHFPGLTRSGPELPCTPDEIRSAVASATSVRDLARTLGIRDDGRTRGALRRRLTELALDVSHFTSSRPPLPADRLRTAVAEATSYADVMRALGLPVNDASHRRIQRKVTQLGLDVTHFKRRSRRTVRPRSRPAADTVLTVRPEGSPRVNRERLHRALDEAGVPYRCVACGNPGEWHGRPLTLQIDHIDGNWLDNRAKNLRYLCPNCHALTDTWCRGVRRRTKTARG
ncbi:HNH endonuclease [Streptomyces sp. 2333.5]|uniref:HNH endonuclease signature motif containing protein n=1 Tax=Streptomyces TaxID=1883 RepID=UPI0008944730|nr:MULTISPECIES: HNH endonuclease [unclassified Streptomyces]PJJ02210.1 HNH endonuclease [Streptomyces sp. 2333.5]SED00276.1 HNH endonuclease [Streptomyces sp. 2314.4]SED86474.1 HNH endonuclease [Streptomyces sp. 2112.2]